MAGLEAKQQRRSLSFFTRVATEAAAIELGEFDLDAFVEATCFGLL